MGVPEVNGKTYIHAFTRRWKILRWLELLCYSLSIASLVLGFCWFIIRDAALSAGAFGLAGLLAGAILYQRYKLAGLNPARAARYLNRKMEGLEYSVELLLAERETLSLPARLQQKHVEQKLLRSGKIKPPVKLLDASLFLLAGILLVATILFFADRLQTTEKRVVAEGKAVVVHPADTTGTHTLQVQLPGLTTGVLQVSPPAYTGQKPYTTGLANLRAPESTRLTWQLQFDAAIEEVWLSLPGKDSVRFRHTRNNFYTAQLNLEQNTLYQLVWSAKGGQTGTTDYLKLEVIYDEAPKIQIKQPAQYMRSREGRAFVVEASARDEWGLSDAYLNMTISRGSGEGVAFRDKKLWFEQDFSSQPTDIALRMELDPQALDMEPGDELYFYLVAFDNRKPRVQQSRSETFIFQWQDTASGPGFEVSGLAMEVMPEYFRSQRQIIIDTEKLIGERGSISEAEFERRAGNLGVDQKLLRLRYGKFLGEEFESGYGPGHENEGEHGDHIHEPEHHHHESSDHQEHEGEEEEEEGRAAMGGQSGPEHAHGHEEQEPGTSRGAGSAADMLRGFMHAHDTEEGATFYEEGVKVKLKAALAQMWEAELRLRTLRLEEALPYEYRALEIIKDVQQATRIYVERVGFEPPPLRPAEKRLTGNLEKTFSSSRVHSKEPDDTLTAIKELVPKLQQNKGAEPWYLSRAELQLLKKAGDELAAIVQQEPRAAYLQSLSLLKEAMNSKEVGPGQKGVLVKTLLEVLPEASPNLQKSAYRNEMEKRFMEKIGGTR